MFNFVRKYLGSQAYPLNKVVVSKESIIGNYRYLSSKDKKVRIAPVLKSNAYGHGISVVGKILDPEKAPFFCVDSLYEAYQLKKSRIKTPVLIMGYLDPQNLKYKKLPFSYAVFDLDFLKELNKFQKGAGVHIFIGTGMSREGVPLSELPMFLEETKKLENIKITGAMTHLASADKPDSQLTHAQIKNFQKAKDIFKDAGIFPEWFHIGGSNALLNKLSYGCNLVRCGKAIYGIGTGDTNLHSALTLKTQIVQVKKINKGAKVGYSETYIAKKDMQIGILPIGYNDGVDRRLSNKGTVLVRGKKCPIIGMISMNVTTIDLSNIEKPSVGEEVVIFSNNPKDINSFESSAKLCGTIPLDLLVHLNPATRREAV